MKKLILSCLMLLLLSSNAISQRLIQRNSTPHFDKCFTQGLEIKNNIVWESCGGYGKSKIFQWDLSNKKILKQMALDDMYFAEGLTQFKDSIFLITWRAGVAFEIDPNTLKTIKQHRYQGEGWGLTNDGKQLIMSNGSSQIQFINPENFKVNKTINVSLNDSKISKLNELEYIDGKIWANVYQTDYIVIINPETGAVEKSHHLPELLKSRKPGVLNGIAHDKTENKIWLTGKNWPLMFEFK